MCVIVEIGTNIKFIIRWHRKINRGRDINTPYYLLLSYLSSVRRQKIAFLSSNRGLYSNTPISIFSVRLLRHSCCRRDGQVPIIGYYWVVYERTREPLTIGRFPGRTGREALPRSRNEEYCGVRCRVCLRGLDLGRCHFSIWPPLGFFFFELILPQNRHV